MKSGSHNQHARLAPSDSKRWTSCSAALAFEEANRHRIPEDRGSRYANEGTRAHDFAADILLGKLEVGRVPNGDTLLDSEFPDTDFRSPVAAYVEHCRSFVPEGNDPMVEVEVPLYYQPTSSGTCDFAVVTDDRVVVRDLKFGAGVLVHSSENSQLAIYTLSLVRMLEDIYEFSPDTEINLAVFQPRHREGHEQKPWVLTLAELEAFGKDIECRAIQAHTALERVREKLPCGQRDISSEEVMEAAPGAKFAPDDDVCRWCKAKAICSVRLAGMLDGFAHHDPQEMLAAMPDLDKAQKKAPVEERIDTVATLVGHTEPLTDDYLVRLFTRSKAIKSFLDDVAEYLEQRALNGNPAEGTKLCWGRPGNREWANPEAADTFLTGQKLSADDRYTKKLISPTQAEKLLKENLKKTRTANRFATLVTRSEPKKVLAPADDKREAVEPDVSAMPDMEVEDFDI